MNSRYVEWLQGQGVSLFKAGDMYWRLYQGTLVPAPATPCFIKLNHYDAKALLKESGAYFLRYSSDPCEKETEWWHIVCDKYEPKLISSNTRKNIKRGKRSCSVRQIDAKWLSTHGYECHFAAYSRYKNAAPVSKEVFRNNILATVSGPFECWGVFIEGNLAGYNQCIIDENNVYISVSKYNPAYLRHRTAYALVNTCINYYVVERGMIICSGIRSISHDTNYQDVLLKLGYRKQFCHLNIFYQPWLKIAIQTLFPLRGVIANLPDYGPIHKLQVLLFQEKIKKFCLQSDIRE